MLGLILTVAGAAITTVTATLWHGRVWRRELAWLMFVAWLALGAGVSLLCGLV